MKDGGESTRLGDGLKDMLQRLGGNDLPVQAAALSAWEEVVGEKIAKHTHVVGVRNGELLVRTDSPTWATELSAMSGGLLERLNEALGETTVTSIRFNASRAVEGEASFKNGASKTTEPHEDAEVTPVPLTEEEKVRLEEMFGGVEDEGLRQAAIRAATRDLEWKKGIRAAKSPQGEA